VSVEARITQAGGGGGKLHDLGYRKYTGTRRVGPQLWRVIAGRGLRSTMRAWYVILILVIASFVIVYGGVLLYGIQTLAKAGVPFKELGTIGHTFLNVAEWDRFWGFVAALLVGSSMLSDDFRTGGVVFYFARPVTRGVYLLGKMAPVVVIVTAINVVPPLLMSLEVLALTGDSAAALLLLKVVLHTIVTVAALCAPAALISSLVRNRLLGMGVYFGLYAGSKVLGEVLGSMLGDAWARCLSISTDVHVLGQWIYGEPTTAPPLTAAIVLVALIGGSLLFAYRRLRHVDILG
jgi:ABC-2 type transport system permease protein